MLSIFRIANPGLSVSNMAGAIARASGGGFYPPRATKLCKNPGLDRVKAGCSVVCSPMMKQPLLAG